MERKDLIDFSRPQNRLKCPFLTPLKPSGKMAYKLVSAHREQIRYRCPDGGKWLFSSQTTFYMLKGAQN